MGILALILGFIIGSELVNYKKQIIDPRGTGEVLQPKIEVMATEKENRSWEGVASYYSREGCVGCSKNLLMANGKPLVNENLTVAFNKLKLGSKVKVINLKNNMSVMATVTDTGGFERLGRIIDLTVGTKNAINCSDLCRVKVEEL